MRKTVIGILAHVDAGKTTLSEAMLYTAGELRAMGRVDHGDAFLDNFALERERGITIFSKEAVFSLPGLEVTLLDTPGHVDFSPEMERTLDVLDAAILVISATAGVQSHTETVWRLLRRHGIPTFLFVNKCDLPAPSRAELLEECRKKLDPGCADLSAPDEEIAVGDERLLEKYLERGSLPEESLRKAVREGRIFPVRFGAALRLLGVEEFLKELEKFAPATPEREAFAARVFKISYENDLRLTHLKVTGGVLRVRDVIKGRGFEEKITQLRRYSGAKFRTVEEARPGDVVAAAGLSRTTPGLGLGAEDDGEEATLEPVLACRVGLPAGIDPHDAVRDFRRLEEEEPALRVEWNERLRELRVHLMGKVQQEVVARLVSDRFGYAVTFDRGSILYRETIRKPAEGVGHFEPLRHYAEVHLLLEPGARGSGFTVSTACREDDLDGNWQRLILTHLLEKTHLGVLTGAPVTDLHVTLMSGRAHLKHTEGGDFREAVYRAVRQGLMKAESILLEPWYAYRIELPQDKVGRLLSDLERMGAEFDPPETEGEEASVTGRAPVETMRDYGETLAAYTRGRGRMTVETAGFFPARDQEKIVRESGYSPEADVANTPDSVFCSHGAGVVVKWSEVEKYMHLPSIFRKEKKPEEQAKEVVRAFSAARYVAALKQDEELLRIFERTYGPVKRDREKVMRPAETAREAAFRASPVPGGPTWLLVDGYNIIFAWDELAALAKENLEHARSVFIDRMRNFQGFLSSPVIVVFDAYKVKGNPGSVERCGDLAVVYTKEAETADMYIEKVTRELGKRHKVRVATSDGLEQIIILSHGAMRLPASEFHDEVTAAEEAIRELIKKGETI
ncbi:MAG: NYN domain-containing protein [Clostridia bacterium]|nr:NYN domain-containing protein [Clostridia bacterium]